MKKKNIEIAEPCHENWADFTPTEKGAFCGSCAIDVVDFSNKNPDEVKAILKANAGQHMCGRFRKSQLEELNNEFHVWENQSYRTFQSKFLYACIMVFGMSLFTSCNVSEQNFLSELGFGDKGSNVALLDVTSPAANRVETDTNKVKNNNQDVTRHLKGKVAYNPYPEEDVQEVICTPDTLEATEFVKGDVVAQIPEEELLGNFIAPIEDTVKQVIVEQDTLFDDEMIDGGLMWTGEYEEYLEDTVDVQQAQPLEDPVENLIEEIKAITGEDSLHLQTTTDTSAHEERIFMEMGEFVAIDPDIHLNEIEAIEDTVENNSAFSLNIIEQVADSNPTFESMLFPNPVIDNTKVVIQVHKSEVFDIYLYAIDGKRVKNIYQGLLSTGRTEFLIDLSAYEAGSYLIVINAEKQKESLRLEKLE